MTSNTSWIRTVLTWTAVMILGLAALKLSLVVVGALTGLVFFLLFTVAPVVLAGWLFVKVLRYFTRGDGYDSA